MTLMKEGRGGISFFRGGSISYPYVTRLEKSDGVHGTEDGVQGTTLKPID